MKLHLYAVMLLVFVACTKTETTTTETTTETASTSTATETTATAATTATETTAGQTSGQETAMTDKVAEIHTTAGDITVRFFPDVAPKHVKNFLDLAQKGFYNGTKFHRVIPGFMIQGGDPNTKTDNVGSWGTGGSGTNIPAEFSSVKHKRGILSMARSSDPNSASSQFFVMVNDYPSLDGQYSVFGQVLKGMDVADKIVNAPKGANDRPNSPTAITSITVREAKPEETGPAPK